MDDTPIISVVLPGNEKDFSLSAKKFLIVVETPEGELVTRHTFGKELTHVLFGTMLNNARKQT